MNGGRGDLNAGDTLGDFRILSRLGKGGMGVVYLARDERLDRRVALKVIVPNLAVDPEFRERFTAEARSAAAIEHPNAVPIYSSGVADGDLYIAMRYIEGTDLRAVLASEGPLDPVAAVRIVAEIAAALDAAHAAGMVHRDVKPANILLQGKPGGDSSYLTDFGLTKGGASTGPLTGTGQWIGTTDYVAPEQIQSDRVDARTDVYALACVLYETLTGAVPYPGNDMQKMWGHVNEQFPTLELEHPSGKSLAAVIERATAKDPADRFASAGDLAVAAGAALSGDNVDVPERSVATGPAATGLAETVTARQLPRDRQPAPTVTGQTPKPMERPTTQMPSPPGRGGGGGASMRTAAIVGGALVIAAGLIAAAVIVAGGSGDNPATTVSAKPAKNGGGSQRRPSEGKGSAPTSTLPANLTACEANVYVEERRPGVPYTSCPFATEVARAYYASGESSEISAFSPTTGKLYPMSCSGSNPTVCRGGTNAAVYITPGTASTPPARGDSASSSSADLGDWPGGSGYTAMLGALSSEWRARNFQAEAIDRGLEAGVLYSSNFSSLRPGYWVVFSGDFATSDEAASHASTARSLGYSDSYPRLVSP